MTMKRAIDLIDEGWAATCHESIYPLLEHVAQRAREEMRDVAAATAQTQAVCVTDAGKIAVAIERLPVTP